MGYLDLDFVFRVVFPELILQGLDLLTQKLQLPWVIALLRFFEDFETAFGAWFLLKTIALSKLCALLFGNLFLHKRNLLLQNFVLLLNVAGVEGDVALKSAEWGFDEFADFAEVLEELAGDVGGVIEEECFEARQLCVQRVVDAKAREDGWFVLEGLLLQIERLFYCFLFSLH